MAATFRTPCCEGTPLAHLTQEVGSGIGQGSPEGHAMRFRFTARTSEQLCQGLSSLRLSKSTSSPAKWKEQWRMPHKVNAALKTLHRCLSPSRRSAHGAPNACPPPPGQGQGNNTPQLWFPASPRPRRLGPIKQSNDNIINNGDNKIKASIYFLKRETGTCEDRENCLPYPLCKSQMDLIRLDEEPWEYKNGSKLKSFQNHISDSF